jgi:hypothetical protein
MVRVLGAYYVVGDDAVRALRRRAWSFGGIATAGNVAARSGRSLEQIARLYERDRNWARVAREVGISPNTLYLALNGPRAVASGNLTEEAGPGGEEGPAPEPAPSARPRVPGRGERGARVAGARSEFVSRRPAVLLRRAVATYYGLPDATLRSLEAQGWRLEEILIAGNLSVRSELSFEEILALRSVSRDWREVARRSGVRQAEIYEPTISRRVSAGTR